MKLHVCGGKTLRVHKSLDTDQMTPTKPIPGGKYFYVVRRIKFPSNTSIWSGECESKCPSNTSKWSAESESKCPQLISYIEIKYLGRIFYFCEERQDGMVDNDSTKAQNLTMREKLFPLQ